MKKETRKTNNNLLFNVELFLYSRSLHISMIVTGFLMLYEQGIIKLKIITNFKNKYKFPHPHFVEAIVNNKAILYDCWDLCDWTAADWEKEKWQDISYNETLLTGIDFYFKRSFLSSRNNVFSAINKKKIFPLGFNFYVSFKNNPLDKYNIFSIDYLKHIAKKHVFTHKFTKPLFIEDIEATANYVISKDLKIIFFSRLWDPHGKDVWNDDKKKEIEYINKTRIDIILKLKQLYPNNFIGGIEYSRLAVDLCKDIILSGSMTNRINYINTMKNSDICIGSMGLHESIGWKTGEYIAAARAIINEKFHFEVPYSFKPIKNYLPFENYDECLSAVSSLMNNPDLVYEQKKENEKYYNNYLRPDKQVLNTFHIIENNQI